ncbi:MAG: alanyl-tRNA editing protein [Eubacteriales bacterium]|nr:alanyl-tRNA editing protein [Eubacteriales bacterium]
METRKLFYEDSHLTAFSARVLACEAAPKGFEIVLDATAFYPEGGGQAGDTGTLGGVRVLDTRERAGRIVHLCDGPLTVGQTVAGAIDWAPRFLRMQQHSGEHIVSGILHSRYGCHNTGFHMGADTVTIDFDTVIPAGDLPAIEAQANAAVWQDLPVRCWVPGPEELEAVTYRTKRALAWPVRIVEIPGFDTCACCGTHVKRTGEIGLIKLFSVVGFRGGTRMEMACGSRALEILNDAYDQNRLVSQAFSAKFRETAAAAQRMNELVDRQKYRLVQLRRKITAATAAACQGAGDVVLFEEDLDGAALRDLADAVAAACGGRAAVFTGSDEAGYTFCLAARAGDLRPETKALTTAFPGRGGGKPTFQQGSVSAAKAEIEAFFEGRK